LALLGGLTFAALELLFDSKIPPLLQGKWVVVEGEFKGATVEFFRDATMTSNRDPASQEGTIHGTVQVEGNLLRLTTRSPLSNREITDVQIILELSDRQLVTQSVKDPKGNVLRMKRVP